VSHKQLHNLAEFYFFLLEVGISFAYNTFAVDYR